MKKTTIVSRSYEAGFHTVVLPGKPLASQCLRSPSRLLRPAKDHRSVGEKILMAMKITTLLMCTVCLHVSAKTNSQTITLTGDRMPLVNVFAEIKKQTGFVVFYTKDLLKNTMPASFSVRDIDLRSFMEIALKDQPLKYKIADRTIILSYKPLVVAVPAPGPNELTIEAPPPMPVKGQVTDEEGKPLANISVVVKGTTAGTATDENGHFSLPDVKPGQVLVFSSVEVETREIRIRDGQSLQVTLKRAVSDLNQVIVVGYGTMKKTDVNAAIASIKPGDLVKVSSPDFSQMLMGRAAGLTVTQGTAQPGGSLNILIRGAASTGAGNQPLYVIDGFPVVGDGVSPGSGNQWSAGGRSPLNDINPNDIESIEILKDAAATAIYGARGANGVILITTKRGGGGKAQVEYSMNMSVQEIIKKPELLTASEFLAEREKYNKETYLINNKLGPYGDTDPGTVAPYTPLFTEDVIAAAGTGTNWYDLVTQSGIVNQHISRLRRAIRIISRCSPSTSSTSAVW